MNKTILFLIINNKSLKIKYFILKIGKNKLIKSNLIIVIGGDGFMLQNS